jgi:transcriptional regulator with XRE-family HTH domain
MAKKGNSERMSPLDRVVTGRVIRAREAAGLNKRELGERLGLADSSYSPYENYRIPFTVEMIGRLAQILGRPIGYFLGLDSGLTEREDRMLAVFRLAESGGFGDMVLGSASAITAQLRQPPGDLAQPVGDKA